MHVNCSEVPMAWEGSQGDSKARHAILGGLWFRSMIANKSTRMNDLTQALFSRSRRIRFMLPTDSVHDKGKHSRTHHTSISFPSQLYSGLYSMPMPRSTRMTFHTTCCSRIGTVPPLYAGRSENMCRLELRIIKAKTIAKSSICNC